MGISAYTGGKVTVDKAVTVHAQSGSGSAYGVYSAGSAEIVFKEKYLSDDRKKEISEAKKRYHLRFWYLSMPYIVYKRTALKKI